MAFTNHALDAILTSVLGITNKIVRLGSRSLDPKMSQYSMETIEMVAGESRLDRSFRHHYRDLKGVEEEIKKLMKSFVQETISSEKFESYLRVQYAEHFEHLRIIPPDWIRTLRAAHHHDDFDAAWMRAGRRGKVETDDNSWYAFWRDAEDLDFLDSSVERQADHVQGLDDQNRFSALAVVEQAHENDTEDVSSAETDAGVEEEEESSEDEDLEGESWEHEWPAGNELESLDEANGGRNDNPEDRRGGIQCQPSPASTQPRVRPTSPIQVADILRPQDFFDGPIPTIPDSNRPLETLLAEGTMWSFSRRERRRLHEYWSAQIKERLHGDQLQEFQRLRAKHEDILKKDRESKDEIRRSLLKDIDIVGCTTTGKLSL